MGFDPLRITVGVWGLGMTGFEVAEQLEQCHGVVVELATSKVWERGVWELALLGPHTRDVMCSNGSR